MSVWKLNQGQRTSHLVMAALMESSGEAPVDEKQWSVHEPSRPWHALHEDLLIKIFCYVEREDLKALLSVSKSFRKAALIAKDTHFAYITPDRTIVRPIWVENAPKALKILRSSSSFDDKKPTIVKTLW